MCGRKGLKPAAPAPAPEAVTNSAVDDSVAVLSAALGLDLDFDIAYIFSPILWQDPDVAQLLTTNGLSAESAGNKIPLFKDRLTLVRFANMAQDDPVRAALVETGFGMVPFEPSASNRFSEGMAQMQLKELRKIAASPAAAQGRKYAVYGLLKWSGDVMKGKVKID